MGWLFTIFFLLALAFVIVMGFPAAQEGSSSSSSSSSSPPPGTDSTPTPGHGYVPRGGVRRTVGSWREWRRSDPTLIKSLWKSKMGNGIRKQLGNAEVYIMLALLIGLLTVVIGCWLSDNCWSPEPEDVAALA